MGEGKILTIIMFFIVLTLFIAFASFGFSSLQTEQQNTSLGNYTGEILDIFEIGGYIIPALAILIVGIFFIIIFNSMRNKI